ncbi:MAG: efflux transporter periplasmic adaptor subunit [Planctomycetota bacterium]
MKKFLAALKPFLSVLLFAAPVAAGVLLLLWAIANRSQPEKLPEQELARALRIIEFEPTAIVPRAIGFGESAASNSFQAIAEVKGKIVQLHPELKSGSFIRSGELLVAIDTADVEITIQKLQAEIARSEASVQELNATKKNYESGLEIEQSSLNLAKRELERMERLYSQNRAVSASEVDTQRRSVLAQQQSVQNLQSSLNLLPAQIQSAEASIKVSQSNLASSQRDLERCRIVAPFGCRLGPVDLELNEVVSVGQQLLTAQAIDKLEVEAQFGLDKIANLIRPEAKAPSMLKDLSVDPQEVIRKFFDVDVTLRYGAGDIRTSREATFERLREQLDAKARTVGIVVSVDRPFEEEGNARENGPAPVPGTYCEVELRGRPIEDAFVVPRSSIRDGTVFLVDDENRLRKRSVEVQLVQNNFAAIKGLGPGDRIVVSDPTPAIEGMLVDPQVDEQLAKTLQAEAGGDE